METSAATDSSNESVASHGHSGSLKALALGALGVVYGDIGTSPLYTLAECCTVGGARPDQHEALLGVVSLIFWALMLVVTFKYVAVLMKADNHGEGGIMALLALVPEKERAIRAGRIAWVSLLVIAGASLLFGDGIITPAISVLSAVEGLGAVQPALAHSVVPITVCILAGLFAVQSRGVGTLGKWFGPIMALWFLSIGALGLVHLSSHLEVLAAIHPGYGLKFLTGHGWRGLHLLGSVVLAVTGGEALYADMGHFGRQPVRLAWTFVVLPCLLLNYFGQAALLWDHPEALSTVFFSMAGHPALRVALVLLATLATIIASQALISAVFSLTQQAVRLGYLPRINIRHTSDQMAGQIYVPAVNWMLAVACICLVAIFQHSARLAAAYGLAVSGTMAITSIVFYSVSHHHWKWPAWKSAALTLFFLSFDIPFFLGTCVKFFEGGYIPFAAGFLMFLVMTTWCSGRSLLREQINAVRQSESCISELLNSEKLFRTPGLGIYLTSSAEGLPHTLAQQLRHFHSVPGEILLVNVVVEPRPYVANEQRAVIRKVESAACVRIARVTGHYGYMEDPDLPALLAEVLPQTGMTGSLDEAVYVVGREDLEATNKNLMGAVPETLFAVISDLAQDVTKTYRLPSDRVVELGVRLDL